MPIFNCITSKNSPAALSEVGFLFVITCFFTFFQNIAFWKAALQAILFDSWMDFIFLLSLALTLFCLFLILFASFLWKPWMKTLLIILVMIGATCNYFSLTYGVYIDKEMLRNVLYTDMHETAALLAPQLFVWIFLLGVLPAILIWKAPIKYESQLIKTIVQRLIIIVGAIAVVFISIFPIYKEYAFFSRNNKAIYKLIVPVNFISASIRLGQGYWQSEKTFTIVGEDAQLNLDTNSKPPLVILVVGETARAQNFSLFGYERDTNPLLSAEKGVLAFQNTSSCATATAISVPCMFSNRARKQFDIDQAPYEDNLTDILQRAGVNTIWYDNNAGCQGVCERIPNVQITATKEKPCPGGYCFDEELLAQVPAYIQAHDKQPMFIILHAIGSHGPSYYQRYPQDLAGKLSPACESNQIQNCSVEQLFNVYDNTIVQTDKMLSQTIQLLKQYEDDYDVSMLYASDHGESLGEKGLYLHSAPYAIAPAEQIHIPMLFWSPESFVESQHKNELCMQEKAKNDDVSHDNIFHTVLGLMGVSTSVYNAKLDLFSSCKN